MQHLQDACIETDAEPGYTAGFHVHVGWPDQMDDEYRSVAPTLGRLVWQFCEWEATLMQVASGRFLSVRDGMNGPVHGLLLTFANNFWGYRQRSMLALRRHVLANDMEITWREYEMLYSRQRGNDRHTNLNLGSRYDTFEYRLWNSTRSAWRMELWCWLSIALTDQTFFLAAHERTITDNPSVELLIELLNSTNHVRAGELLARQYNYMASRPIVDTEPAFTVV